MVTLAEAQYRDKVLGGWLGKLIGCAVGSSLDGRKQTHELEADPQGLKLALPRASEGFSFHLAWLRTLERAGPRLTPADLIATWLQHLLFGEHEYGHAVANFRRELAPPVSGVFDNPFREAMGAVARAELWGLVAPGDPEAAAHYAHQDAMLDHGGSGVEAAIWAAVMVSAAFVETDPARLVEVGLRFLPPEARSARAVRDVARWHGELANWRRTREMLLRAYGSEDVRDSVVVAGLIALSLLDARGDFARGIATAARCGWSTSCTCGAVGAIAGVMLGGAAVAPEWQDVMGVEAAPELCLGSELVGLPSATTLASLAARTYEAGRLVARSQSRGRVELVAEPLDEAETKSSQSASGDLAAAEVSGFLRDLATGPYVTYNKRANFGVHIDYDARPTVGYDVPRRLTITLANLAERSVDLSTRIAAPAGFVVTFNSDRTTLPEGGTVSFSATISAPREQARISAVSPCTLIVSAEGGEEEAVPITLIGEALWHAAGPYGDFEQSYPPEDPGILSGEIALGGEGWQPLSVPEPAVNLLAGLEGDRGVYYLATDLLAPRARQARLRVACNDGTRVWCNGQQLWQQHEHRPADARVSADEFPAELREGWNRLVIKMAQCSPRRLLSVVVKDPDGQILVEVVNTAPRPEKG